MPGVGVGFYQPSPSKPSAQLSETIKCDLCMRKKGLDLAYGRTDRLDNFSPIGFCTVTGRFALGGGWLLLPQPQAVNNPEPTFVPLIRSVGPLPELEPGGRRWTSVFTCSFMLSEVYGCRYVQVMV